MSNLSSLKDSKIVIQPNLLTTAKYSFTVTEKRIFYRIVELLQIVYEGKKVTELLSKNFMIDKDLWGREVFRIPISKVLPSKEYKNYESIRNAFDSLMKKYISIEDEESLTHFSVFQKARYLKKEFVLEFVLTEEVLKSFELLAKGFKRYDLKAVFQFDSIYTMRLFEILHKQKDPLPYKIDEIKKWFDIEDKYKTNYDFFRYVIDVAQKEMKEKAPIQFTYKKNPAPGSRKINSITFFTKPNPKNIPEDEVRQTLNQELSPRNYIDKDIVTYLKEVIGFTDFGLKANLDLFKKASKELPLTKTYIAKIRASAINNGAEIEEVPGNIINTLRNRLYELRQERETTDKNQPEFDFSSINKNNIK